MNFQVQCSTRADSECIHDIQEREKKNLFRCQLFVTFGFLLLLSFTLIFSFFNQTLENMPSEKQSISEQMNEKQRNVLLIYLSKSFFFRPFDDFKWFSFFECLSINNLLHTTTHHLENKRGTEKCFISSISEKISIVIERSIEYVVFLTYDRERELNWFYIVRRIDSY